MHINNAIDSSMYHTYKHATNIKSRLHSVIFNKENSIQEKSHKQYNIGAFHNKLCCIIFFWQLMGKTVLSLKM